jgi:hypothetical protein
MTRAAHRILKVALAVGIGFCVLLTDEQASLINQGWLGSQAEARIGRPLTPMSYAGVARRTTRRAVYGAAAVGTAAAVGAAAYGAYAAPVAPTCYQAVDAYGRVYTRCP